MKIIDYAIRTLAVVYLTCVVRQFAWIVPHPLAAWGLTAVVTAGLAAWLAPRRRALGLAIETTPDFALWVVLPLAVYYLLEMPFPDLAIDLGNYHFVNAERGLRGWPNGPRDEWAAFLNPLADMITGLSRWALGYRLGTAASFLALIWTAAGLERLLRPRIVSSRVRHLAVLWLCAAEGMLLQSHGYMVDLMALPLFVEALQLALAPTVSAPFLLGLSLGVGVALKITNLPFAAAIWLTALRRGGVRSALVAALGGIVALAPYHGTQWVLTGNPFYPLFARLFDTPTTRWMKDDDTPFAPENWGEVILWPAIVTLHPNRGWELWAYGGRIGLGALAALVTIRRREVLGGIFAVACFGWALTTGNLRYAFFLELLAGLVVVTTVASFRDVRARVAAGAALGLQAMYALSIACTWSTMFHSRRAPLTAWYDEARGIFLDRRLADTVSEKERAQIDAVEGWVKVQQGASGMQALLRPDVPFLNLYLLTHEEKLIDVAHRRYYALCSEDGLADCHAMLRDCGLVALAHEPITLPLFSPYEGRNYRMMRIGLAHSENGPGENRRPTGDGWMRADVTIEALPDDLHRNQTRIVGVSLRNTGGHTWHPGEKPELSLGSLWRRQTGEIVANGPIIRLKETVPPGGSIRMPLKLIAPAESGDLELVVDMLRENTYWFHEQRKSGARWTLSVRD